MKIVLSGDLHLGRTSTRLPISFRERGRSIQAWEALVEAILNEKADLLLLSGDVLDNRNFLWESMGPLQEGIARLAAAGIRTLAVSGNHDATSLPDVAAQLPPDAFTLLGAGGNWQRETLLRDGHPVLHVDGWSFPSASVQIDPTRSYPGPSATDGVPVLVMVHGDLGSPVSNYAPLNLSHLQTLPVSAWLLGHIHKPACHPGTPWVLMPGSPHPLDPGEPGAHHAWICELKEGKLSPPSPFCPAKLRYEEIECRFRPDDPVSIDLIHAQLQQAIDQLDRPDMCLLRIRLSGHCADLPALREQLAHLQDWAPPGIAVESIKWDVHPALNLADLAQAGPVPALLVQALEAPPAALQKRLHTLCESLQHQSEFAGKDLSPIDPATLPLGELLERTLLQAMEQLQ